jgi:hypothetical protein
LTSTPGSVAAIVSRYLSAVHLDCGGYPRDRLMRGALTAAGRWSGTAGALAALST